MKQRKHQVPRDIFGALPALREAAKDAREIAKRTGTPLVVVQDGKVVKLYCGKDGKWRRQRG